MTQVKMASRVRRRVIEPKRQRADQARRPGRRRCRGKRAPAEAAAAGDPVHGDCEHTGSFCWVATGAIRDRRSFRVDAPGVRLTGSGQWGQASGVRPVGSGQWGQASGVRPVGSGQWGQANAVRPMGSCQWGHASGAMPVGPGQWGRADGGQPWPGGRRDRRRVNQTMRSRFKLQCDTPSVDEYGRQPPVKTCPLFNVMI